MKWRRCSRNRRPSRRNPDNEISTSCGSNVPTTTVRTTNSDDNTSAMDLMFSSLTQSPEGKWQCGALYQWASYIEYVALFGTDMYIRRIRSIINNYAKERFSAKIGFMLCHLASTESCSYRLFIRQTRVTVWMNSCSGAVKTDVLRVIYPSNISYNPKDPWSHKVLE